MKIALLVTATILFFTSYGQIDTTKIYNCTHLKKGFYRNYNEFINNSPSKNLDFIVIPLIKSQTDTTVVGAEYRLADSLKEVHHVWGFCDGSNVFVNFSESPFKKHYWKMLGLGPTPFFSYNVKEILMVGGPLMMLATATLSASIPAEYELMRINKNGKIKDLGVIETYDLLEDQPQLLKEFMAKTDRHLKLDPDPRRNKSIPPLTQSEQQKQQALITEYLTKLNDILKKG